MKNILLVLPSTGASSRATEYAVKTAKKESATLFALYILETEPTKEVLERFMDIGFVGDKPMEELSEAMMKEYRQRGYEALGEVQIKAMEEAVPFEPLLETGERLPLTLDVIKRNDIGLAIVVRKKARAIARYLTGSRLDELKEEAPCKVEILDED
ncbi:MAG: universal stress protein [Deltaproteobacteria bacterium]|nr:universal stress protein [Deltaproteobacteria bacterium]